MRTLTRAGVLSAVASAAFLVAPVAHATAPGDNGTVKIHDASTGEELRKNEPHVCTFYLDAFGFDAVQQVDWHIEAWAPTADVKGETVTSGAITLDSDGHGRTNDLSLPDGHYKLFWNFEGEKSSAAKHKVFWTDCEDEQGGGGGTATPTGSATPEPSGSSTAEPSGEPSTGPSTEPSESTEAGATPSASASAQGSTGDLAETGSSAPVGLLAGISAALLAAGGYLVVRRRRA